MTIYRVRWNFDAADHAWTATMRRIFGPHNEGATVEAEDAKAAVKAFGAKHNILWGYLTAKEEN